MHKTLTTQGRDDLVSNKGASAALGVHCGVVDLRIDEGIAAVAELEGLAARKLELEPQFRAALQSVSSNVCVCCARGFTSRGQVAASEGSVRTLEREIREHTSTSAIGPDGNVVFHVAEIGRGETGRAPVGERGSHAKEEAHGCGAGICD